MSGLEPVEKATPRTVALTWLAVAVLLTTLGSAPARAQGFYAGGSAVWLDPGNGLAELGDSGYHLVVGYETGSLAGVEVGYLGWSGPVTEG